MKKERSGLKAPTNSTSGKGASYLDIKSVSQGIVTSSAFYATYSKKIQQMPSIPMRRALLP